MIASSDELTSAYARIAALWGETRYSKRIRKELSPALYKVKPGRLDRMVNGTGTNYNTPTATPVGVRGSSPNTSAVMAMVGISRCDMIALPSMKQPSASRRVFATPWPTRAER